MSLQREEIGPIPEETARIARAAFPKGNRYMRLRAAGPPPQVWEEQQTICFDNDPGDERQLKLSRANEARSGHEEEELPMLGGGAASQHGKDTVVLAIVEAAGLMDLCAVFCKMPVQAVQ